MGGKRVINLKKFYSIILITIIITTFFTITVNANNINYKTEKIEFSPSGIKMAVDGKEITFPDQKPLLDAQAGRTYIPIRFLAEALGADVNWINEHQVVEIVNKGIEGENTKNVYYMKIGSNKVIQARYDNGGNVASGVSVFDMPENIVPVLEGGRTVIPFRYIAELMGAQVYYDPTTGVAHCVKIESAQYSDNISYGSLSVFNSLISEYFVDELNKYRATFGRAPVRLNGDYSDMMTWAAFDQITNPGQWEYYQKDHKGVELHLFSWNRNTVPKNDVTLFNAGSENARKYNVWHYGAYYQYIKTYPPNHPVYGKEMRAETHGYGQDYKLEHWENGYAENAFVSRPLVEGYAVKNLNLGAELYEEFTKYWGLKIRKMENVTYDANFNLIPGPKNGEYSNILIYNEATYRNMARKAIENWSYSSGHKQVMLTPYATQVGFATVGRYTYMCSTNS